ncbi:hypothetical protein BVI1335_610010 [Burkholderia vietnamiensis]|nr:hypothetical protein BVI1335_610010 [Burkholderia vietnamiensis]
MRLTALYACSRFCPSSNKVKWDKKLSRSVGAFAATPPPAVDNNQ